MLLLVVIMAWWSFFPPLLATAQYYQPLAPVKILTVNQGFEGDVNPDTATEWTVIYQIENKAEKSLSFYPADTPEMVCRLVLTSTGIRIIWNNTDRIPHAVSTGNLFIVPGASVPCDLLPVEQAEDSTAYEYRRQLGGHIFVETIQVERVEINPQEALRNGWLRGEVQSNKQLVMIRAFSQRTKALLVQQLWADGDHWWIYEETPVRLSWRVR